MTSEWKTLGLHLWLKNKGSSVIPVERSIYHPQKKISLKNEPKSLRKGQDMSLHLDSKSEGERFKAISILPRLEAVHFLQFAYQFQNNIPFPKDTPRKVCLFLTLFCGWQFPDLLAGSPLFALPSSPVSPHVALMSWTQAVPNEGLLSSPQ